MACGRTTPECCGYLPTGSQRCVRSRVAASQNQSPTRAEQSSCCPRECERAAIFLLKEQARVFIPCVRVARRTTGLARLGTRRAESELLLCRGGRSRLCRHLSEVVHSRQ